jgi:hypothetical protein
MVFQYLVSRTTLQESTAEIDNDPVAKKTNPSTLTPKQQNPLADLSSPDHRHERKHTSEIPSTHALPAGSNADNISTHALFAFLFNSYRDVALGRAHTSSPVSWLPLSVSRRCRTLSHQLDTSPARAEPREKILIPLDTFQLIRPRSRCRCPRCPQEPRIRQPCSHPRHLPL